MTLFSFGHAFELITIERLDSLLKSLVMLDQFWRDSLGVQLHGPLSDKFVLLIVISIDKGLDLLLDSPINLVLRANGGLKCLLVEIVGLTVCLEVSFKFFAFNLVSQLTVKCLPDLNNLVSGLSRRLFSR